MSSANAGAILVLYWAREAPMRASVADHLYAFRRYSGRRCIYVNLAVRRVPRWIDRLAVDVVVLHTVLLAQRWHRPTFRRVLERLRPIRGLDAVVVALPQDEYIHTDALGDAYRELGVNLILSTAPESEWHTIYGGLLEDGPSIRQVLTGYLEPETIERIRRLSDDVPRTVDVGYRAYDPEYSLGRHAQLKARIAHVFNEAAPQAGLRADISLRAEDTLLGDAWYRFLLACRWVIGVEGGASVLDRDGALLDRTRAYQAAHPTASFDEVEAACFPGADGTIRLVAISPRHLEACATRTAQVLVEGSYNGILRPGEHYLELRADFSNLSTVVETMADERLRESIAARAYEDVVVSNRYTYPAFVQGVLADLPARRRRSASVVGRILARWDAALDSPSWLVVRATTRARRTARRVLARIGLLDAALRVRSRSWHTD